MTGERQHVVATGPYMIPNDKSGKITDAGYQANKKLVLVRNPNWDKSKDYRPAYLNRIEFLGGQDLNVASRKILQGQSFVNGDFAAPPVPVFKDALTHYKSQVGFTPGDSLSAHFRPHVLVANDNRFMTSSLPGSIASSRRRVLLGRVLN